MTPTAFFWQGLPFLARTLTHPWQLLLLAGPWLAWLAGLGGRVLLELWPDEARRRRTVPLFAGLLTMTLLGAYGVLNPTTTNVPVPDAPIAIYGEDEIALLSADTAGHRGRTDGDTARPLAGPPADQPGLHRLLPCHRPGCQALGPTEQPVPRTGSCPPAVGVRARSCRISTSSPWPPTRRSAAITAIFWGCYRVADRRRLTSGTDDKVVLTP